MNSEGSGTPATTEPGAVVPFVELPVRVGDDMDEMEEDGVGLVRMGRRRECVRSEIEIEERDGWRGGRSVMPVKARGVGETILRTG